MRIFNLSAKLTSLVLTFVAALACCGSTQAAIVSSGLIQDLNGDLGVTVANGGVTAWGNQIAGVGNNLNRNIVNGTAATVLSGVVNGHDALRVDGSSGAVLSGSGVGMTGNAAFDALMTGNGFTWFAVARVPEQTGANNINDLFGTLVNGSPFGGFSGGVTNDEFANNRIRPNASNVLVNGASNLNDGNFHILAGRLQAGLGSRTLEVFADGPIAEGTALATILNTTDTGVLSIGAERAGATGPAGFTGDIARLLIYNRPLNSEEFNLTGLQLATTYGVQSSVFVPEPSSVLLGICGLFGVVLLMWRRRK